MNQVKSKDSIGKLGSDLLEAVDGLEAAQAIVNDAPEGAEYFSRTNTGNAYYRQVQFGYERWIDGLWCADDFNFGASGINRLIINLSYLRTAIDEYESNQRVADLKQRVEKAKAALSTFNYKPEVCVEEETPELFQSKHCSPRLLEHMKFDVSVVPVSKQGCTACATKDHDLKALRKWQASNLSIYAGRVHSQQTHILMREVIICVLVIACIGLVLWGLR